MDESVLDQTSTAEAMLTGLLAAFGLVVVCSVIVLTRDDSAWQAGLGAALAVVWLLRSRSYAGAGQRIVLVCTGLLTLVWLGVWLAGHGDQVSLLVAVAALVSAAVLTLLYGGRVLRGRKSPHWGRFLDVAEFVALMSLIPIAGVVLGLYDAIRGAL